MNFEMRLNKKLSTDTVNVYSLRLIKNKSIQFSLDKFFDLIDAFEAAHAKILPSPIYDSLDTLFKDKSDIYYLEPSRDLNAIFALKANFAQQVRYIELMGLTAAIERRPEFRDAIKHFVFCESLKALEIENVKFNYKAEPVLSSSVKRIHLVHQFFLDDEEIASGLHISARKNTPDNQVLYVSTPEALKYAVSNSCQPLTLIVDGHWEHKLKSTHGVWEYASADDIAEHFYELLKSNPDKVKSIKLWGCHSGEIRSFDKDDKACDASKIKFKDEMHPSFAAKEMSVYRNRAIYYSEFGETPFEANSLASVIFTRLSSFNVSVAASPSMSYPYPPNSKRALYNISSDSSLWSGPHFWAAPENEDSRVWNKLKTTKSVKVIPPSHVLEASPDLPGFV